MKRSEMLKVIEGAIDRACGSVGERRLYPPDNYLAYVILKAIEVAGMAPPEVKEFVEIPPHNILGAGFKVGHNVHKWEDESQS